MAELSRLGRNMFGVINIINELSESGVEIVFVQQPELPTRGPQRKLLLAIYRYFAKAEREFISIRTKQGPTAVRANGKKLGRPKGSRDKKRVLDPYREQIKGYLALKEDNTATQSHQNQSATKEANLLQFVPALRSTR